MAIRRKTTIAVLNTEMKKISFNEWLLLEEALKNPMRAFHGGAAFDGDFDLDNIGSGEERMASTKFGMKNMLGPGIYFSNCDHIAALYVKHAMGKAALHEVILNTSRIYDRRNGSPHLNPAFEAIKKKYSAMSQYASLFEEKHPYDALLKALPPKQAMAELVANGIDGQFTRLFDGCLEIVVINPAVIKKVGMKRTNKEDSTEMTPDQLQKERDDEEAYKASRFKPTVAPEPGITSQKWYEWEQHFVEKAEKEMPQYADLVGLMKPDEEETYIELTTRLDDIMGGARWGDPPNFDEFFDVYDKMSQKKLGRPLDPNFRTAFLKVVMPYYTAIHQHVEKNGIKW